MCRRWAAMGRANGGNKSYVVHRFHSYHYFAFPPHSIGIYGLICKNVYTHHSFQLLHCISMLLFCLPGPDISSDRRGRWPSIFMRCCHVYDCLDPGTALIHCICRSEGLPERRMFSLGALIAGVGWPGFRVSRSRRWARGRRRPRPIRAKSG